MSYAARTKELLAIIEYHVLVKKNVPHNTEILQW